MEKTETGIDITNYISERDAKIVSISKPNKASGNYLYARAKFHPEIVNGVAVVIEDEPEYKNINRQSVADMRANIAKQEAEIAHIKAQLDAIEADMTLCD